MDFGLTGIYNENPFIKPKTLFKQMKNLFILSAVALGLASLYSCKKCYNCTREAYCYTCKLDSDTTQVTEKCADPSQSQDDFNTYISGLSGYTCTSKLKAAKDEKEVCDGGLVSTTTGISIDKTTMELNGWSCAKK